MSSTMSVTDGISVDINHRLGDMAESLDDIVEESVEFGRLKHLANWPPVNILFQDITQTVPDVTCGNKVILRSVSGQFKSGQLCAIMGPSGAGKSSLLNVLAGYKSANVQGMVYINGKPRDLKTFQRMSRYIMQQDVYQPMLSVKEAMTISANLKLGSRVSAEEKEAVINEILALLRLTKATNTRGHLLSGGERKRLSIALELVNNPPVIFLDEPTTGLDDLSSSQCVSLLRRIAHGGRTVICSIHTPSAKMFAMFDHVYIMASGQCVYQGHSSNIVSYVQSIGLNCPVTYNPADFVIEVSCGEYGYEYVEKMVTSVSNGKCNVWTPAVDNKLKAGESSDDHLPQPSAEAVEAFEQEIDPAEYKTKTSNWEQFRILHKRMTIQMWRDSNYLKLRIYMHILLGFLIGSLFWDMGNDASKTLFNFGFCFTIMIFFMYIPMMPILLEFPTQVQLLKREHFNKWYRLVPYYSAMIVAKLPIQLTLAALYITIVYSFTGQPLEWERIGMFYLASILVSLSSESFGLLVSSRLSIVNSMFVGPVLTVPMMLLAVYGIGFGKGVIIPGYIRALMSVSYLRYGLEGIIAAIYHYDRADMICPETEVYCQYRNAKYLMVTMGFEGVHFGLSVAALVFFYILFNACAFYLIRQRLSVRRSSIAAVAYIGQFVKQHLNLNLY